jgi:hypothetical protein
MKLLLTLTLLLATGSAAATMNADSICRPFKNLPANVSLANAHYSQIKRIHALEYNTCLDAISRGDTLNQMITVVTEASMPLRVAYRDSQLAMQQNIEIGLYGATSTSQNEQLAMDTQSQQHSSLTLVVFLILISIAIITGLAGMLYYFRKFSYTRAEPLQKDKSYAKKSGLSLAEKMDDFHHGMHAK